MCRDIHELPSKYQAQNVIGITEGAGRPTVYFDDGARYTQAHIRSQNVGLKLPELHHFFGNFPRQAIDSIFEEATEIRLRDNDEGVQYLIDKLTEHPELGRNIRGNKFVPPTRPAATDNPETMVLVEIKRVRGQLTPHRSRGMLRPVDPQRAQELLDEIRSRKNEPVPIDFDEDGDPIWGFADPDPDEAGGAGSSSESGGSAPADGGKD